jgi:DNA invertase Pin-like site-specific DNA recombinase
MNAIGINERVSSDTQDTASQHRDLGQWAKGREVEWFKDTFTGTTMDRPAWERLWTACCAGRIDTIVVWRLDRLGRTARGLITLRDELIARKLNLVSLRDSLDLSAPSGRLMFSIIASVAEYETEVRRERQLAGIAVVKSKGTVYRGRAKGQMNAKTRAMVGTVYAMVDAGVSVRAIAKTVKLSRPAIDRMLRNRGRW